MALATVEHLQREHQETERLLSSLGLYLRALKEDPDFDSRDVSSLIEFLVDAFFVRHEEKEEAILLPEMVRGGCPPQAPILAKLHDEHEHGKKLLTATQEALCEGSVWSPQERAKFISLASSWREFIYLHMKREEEFLFPRLGDWITEESDEWIVREFERLDLDFDRQEDSQRMRAAAEAFVFRFENRAFGLDPSC